MPVPSPLLVVQCGEMNVKYKAELHVHLAALGTRRTDGRLGTRPGGQPDRHSDNQRGSLRRAYGSVLSMGC